MLSCETQDVLAMLQMLRALLQKLAWCDSEEQQSRTRPFISVAGVLQLLQKCRVFTDMTLVCLGGPTWWWTYGNINSALRNFLPNT